MKTDLYIEIHMSASYIRVISCKASRIVVQEEGIKPQQSVR